MTDRFASQEFSLSSPAFGGFAILPSDTGDLRETTRAIYIGQAGNLAVVLASGDNVIFTALSEGTLLPVRATRVLSTSTTAASLVGLI